MQKETKTRVSSQLEADQNSKGNSFRRILEPGSSPTSQNRIRSSKDFIRKQANQRSDFQKSNWLLIVIMTIISLLVAGVLVAEYVLRYSSYKEWQGMIRDIEDMSLLAGTVISDFNYPFMKYFVQNYPSYAFLKQGFTDEQVMQGEEVLRSVNLPQEVGALVPSQILPQLCSQEWTPSNCSLIIKSALNISVESSISLMLRNVRAQARPVFSKIPITLLISSNNLIIEAYRLFTGYSLLEMMKVYNEHMKTRVWNNLFWLLHILTNLLILSLIGALLCYSWAKCFEIVKSIQHFKQAMLVLPAELVQSNLYLPNYLKSIK